LTNRERAKLRLMAVKTPGSTPDQIASLLHDLGVMTGARPVVGAAGDTLQNLTPDYLGHARKAWADRDYFGLIGGKGNARALRAHIAELRATHKAATDTQIRKDLQARLGKLLGGSATLWVGAATESEIKTRKELAERTADALRGAVREGLLPGGGMALLGCVPALRRKLEASREEDERAAYRILLQAAGEPLRALVSNGGYELSHVMAELERARRRSTERATLGFDALTGQVVSLAEAGILDVASVHKTSIRRAVVGAALALTVEVLVHHKNPPTDLEPK
jgi:chaperonin GroEL